MLAATAADVDSRRGSGIAAGCVGAVPAPYSGGLRDESIRTRKGVRDE